MAKQRAIMVRKNCEMKAAGAAASMQGPAARVQPCAAAQAAADQAGKGGNKGGYRPTPADLMQVLQRQSSVLAAVQKKIDEVADVTTTLQAWRGEIMSQLKVITDKLDDKNIDDAAQGDDKKINKIDDKGTGAAAPADDRDTNTDHDKNTNGKKIDDKRIDDDKNTVGGAAPASDHNRNIDDKKITSGAAPLHVIMYDETPEEGECVGP